MKVDFNLISYVVSIFLIILMPALTLPVLVYNIMLIISENMQRGEQVSRTPLLKGAVLFITAAIAGFVLWSIFNQFVKFQVMTMHYPFLATLGFAFVVANHEEEIFRNLFIKIFGVFPASIIYTVLHFYTGTGVLGFSGSQVIGYMVFTFLFALGMYYSQVSFRSLEVAKALHFSFLLFNYGYATILFGVM